MNLLLAILLILLAFLAGVIAGFAGLKNAIQREGYVMFYDEKKRFGKGKWVIKRPSSLIDP